jgi:hypothetical protein
MVDDAPMRSVRALNSLLAILLLGTVARCQQDPDVDPAARSEQGASDPTVTDAKDKTPSDFARFEAEGEGGHFDIAVTTYRNAAGQELILFGAVHIADAAHYAELQRRFALCNALLYELVGPEDYRPSRGEERAGMVAALQNSMKQGLELEFQLDGVDYRQDNFVHADMTPEEMREAMEERGETLFGMMMKLGMQGQKAMAESGRKDPTADFDLVKAFRSGEGRHQLRMMMASQLEMMEMMAAGGGRDGSTLLEGRNEKCLEVLQRELKKGHKVLGIYYGAAHLPHMEKRLVEDLGFNKVDHEWLVAWDCTPRKDPVVDRQLWRDRRKAKNDLAKVRLAIQRWRLVVGNDAGGLPSWSELLQAKDKDSALLYDGGQLDPWGNGYRIEPVDSRLGFVVRTAGPDGVFGTEDDLTSRR